MLEFILTSFVYSSTIPNQIRSEDIRNAILCTKEFDFLTNKFLGVAKPKEQSNL